MSRRHPCFSSLLFVDTCPYLTEHLSVHGSCNTSSWASGQPFLDEIQAARLPCLPLFPPGQRPTLPSPGRHKGLLWLKLQLTILLFLSSNTEWGRGAHLMVLTLAWLAMSRTAVNSREVSSELGAIPPDLHAYFTPVRSFCRNFRGPCFGPEFEGQSGLERNWYL